MEIYTFITSPIQSNCYVLSESNQRGAKAVVIDPGDLHLEPVFEYIDSHGYEVVANWNTHAHFDHILGVDLIRKRYDVKSYLHHEDQVIWNRLAEDSARWLGTKIEELAEPDVYLNEGDKLFLGDLEFSVLFTPGHSPGSICFIGKEIAFTGDTLFAGSIGRVDLPLSSPTDMEHSLNKIKSLPDELRIYPGHGGISTIGREKHFNPFL